MAGEVCEMVINASLDAANTGKVNAIGSSMTQHRRRQITRFLKMFFIRYPLYSP
jgi:hypothetical protein